MTTTRAAARAVTQTATRATTRPHPLRLLALRTWLPVVLIVWWWLASAGSRSLYFPPLSTILETLQHDWLGPGLTANLLPSLGKFLAGFLIAAACGIVFGLLIGMSRTLAAAVEPIVQFLRSLPPPVLLPIGILVFGIGAPMNIAIIAFGAVWPTLLNTIDGVRSLDSQVRDMSRSYRLTLGQRVRYIVVPNAGPQIFAGLRTTLQISIILIVVSEMVASVNGIGYYLLNSQQTFAVPQTWAGTLLLGALGYVANLLFLRIESRVLRWHSGMRAASGKDA
ncbi:MULTISPECIES: ABC transporter permease [unclassified Arthrobacter]|uniref:ABC transporter permease n=1 Tax=unclassified Arthrobacter TaxID=235627 RepID=UPI00159D1C0F|nr:MULTISPECIES: ABC transporter permease [unclassified Arthrobacter]MCQ9165181.1 ABC transporter permease [Arthrobacter sp. STN4]NVM98085.1 ABC transporter permease [Arthrobacter sp. SDTb3-6]